MHSPPSGSRSFCLRVSCIWLTHGSSRTPVSVIWAGTRYPKHLHVQGGGGSNAMRNRVTRPLSGLLTQAGNVLDLWPLGSIDCQSSQQRDCTDWTAHNRRAVFFGRRVKMCGPMTCARTCMPTGTTGPSQSLVSYKSVTAQHSHFSEGQHLQQSVFSCRPPTFKPDPPA